MLTMNEKIIITEKDFCDNYNQDELLAQKEDFWVFAQNNWLFMSPRAFACHCYDVYRMSLQKRFTRDPKEWSELFELDTATRAVLKEKQQEQKLNDIFSSLEGGQKLLLDELFASYTREKRYNWQNDFYADASVLLLSLVHMKRLKAMFAQQKEEQKPVVEEFNIVSLINDKIELRSQVVNGTLRRTFDRRYDSEVILKQSDSIKSKQILACDTDVVLRWVGVQTPTTVLSECELKKGESLWVNTVDGIVVSVIENYVSSSSEERSHLPRDAYSIVEISPNLFVYLRDGRLKQNASTTAIDERWRSYPGKFVELSTIDGKLYALTDRGNVFTRNQIIPDKTVTLSRLRRQI